MNARDQMDNLLVTKHTESVHWSWVIAMICGQFWSTGYGQLSKKTRHPRFLLFLVNNIGEEWQNNIFARSTWSLLLLVSFAASAGWYCLVWSFLYVYTLILVLPPHSRLNDLTDKFDNIRRMLFFRESRPMTLKTLVCSGKFCPFLQMRSYSRQQMLVLCKKNVIYYLVNKRRYILGSLSPKII